VSVTGFPNADLTDAARQQLVQDFMANGQSNHSGRGERVWALLEHCRTQGISFRVEVATFEGRPVGVRIVRTDLVPVPVSAKVPAGWSVEFVKV
jgi:hypothetical protein